MYEGAVSAPARDFLRAPQVDVDGIAVPFDDLRGGEEMLGVIGAKLHDQWPIRRGVTFFARRDIEELSSVFCVPFREELRMEFRN